MRTTLSNRISAALFVLTVRAKGSEDFVHDEVVPHSTWPDNECCRGRVIAESTNWESLIDQLGRAERALHAAMARLALAEQRYFGLADRQLEKEPDWYIGAQDEEAVAANALEVIYEQIADTRANGSQGLTIKLRLLAMTHGINPDRTASEAAETDLAARLIYSLLKDIRSVP